MSGITIHRFVEASRHTEGDLTVDDLGNIWRKLQAERLVEVFFRDGMVCTYYDFLRYVRMTGCWFYAVKRGAEYLGLGVVSDHSDSGNTAYAHFVTFKAGRRDFAEAARMWFPVMADNGLDTLIAVLPGCYRAAVAWAKELGFEERMRLPGALRLMRGRKSRHSDAVVLIKDLRKLRSVNNQ